MLAENNNHFAVPVLINYSCRGLKDEYIIKLNSNLLHMSCYKKLEKLAGVSTFSLLTTIDLLHDRLDRLTNSSN